jgi:hypothetical protein
MSSTTLAIGSASYQLLDELTGSSLLGKASGSVVSLSNTGKSDFSGLGIGGTDKNISGINNISVRSNLSDLTADLGGGGDTLNIIGNVNGASIALDNSIASGNDLLSIQGNLGSPFGYSKDLASDPDRLTNNQIYAGDGNDTIRIAGQVESTNFYLGSGNDSLLIGGDSDNVYVSGDQGRDYIEFRGMANDVVVQAGADSDTVVFRGQISGSDFGGQGWSQVSDRPTAAVELGAGSDSLVLGNGARNVEVNSGQGNDTLRLAGYFENSNFQFSPNNFGFNPEMGDDLITSSANSGFSAVNFSSSNQSDTLIFGSSNQFYGTNFDIGSQDSSSAAGSASLLTFGSNSSFIDSSINAGSGADTIVFGANSIFDNLSLDLGSDNSTDVISFASSTADMFERISVTGASDGDILWIGSTQYTYSNDAFRNDSLSYFSN